MIFNEVVAWATIGAFVVSLVSLAFSARRWLAIRGDELKSKRFETYHRVLHSVSTGSSEFGHMKLANQLAFLYEMRNFPEYASLTRTVLGLLRREWAVGEHGDRKEELIKGVDDTLSALRADN
jgi:hypothetical protein